MRWDHKWMKMGSYMGENVGEYDNDYNEGGLRSTHQDPYQLRLAADQEGGQRQPGWQKVSTIIRIKKYKK